MRQPDDEFDWSRIGRTRWAVEPRVVAVIAAVCVLTVLVVAVSVARARGGAASAQPLVVSTPAASLAGSGSTEIGRVGPTGSAAPRQTEGSTGIGGSGPGDSHIVVHVVGPVLRPGLTRLPAGSRVGDAIEAAGGMVGRARPAWRRVNWARVLQDGEQVDPSGRNESNAGSVAGGPGTGGAAGGADQSSAKGSDGLLDLNRATQADLEELPRIGPVTAKKILDYRQRHGRFDSVEQLKEIGGIGEKTFEQLAPLVRV